MFKWQRMQSQSHLPPNSHSQELWLDVHGVCVRVVAPLPFLNVLEDLKGEFGYFACAQSPRCDFEVRLHSVGAQHLPHSWRWHSQLGDITSFEGRRWVRFKDGSWIAFRDENGCRFADVGIALTDEACGNLGNFMHSTLGEKLEARGFVRFHALGSLKTHALIELAPRGFGKSTKGRALLSAPETLLFGDEIVLVKNARAFPYPARIATNVSSGEEGLRRTFLGRTKTLAIIERKKVAPPTELSEVRFYTRAPFGLRRLWFIISLCLGLGLPQMKEYMLRLDAVPLLTRFFMQRSRLALRLAFSKRLQCRTTRYLEP